MKLSVATGALLILSLIHVATADIVAVVRVLKPMAAIAYSGFGLTEFENDFFADAAAVLKVPASR